jgi:malonyl CoA-acyl carrier protein transacylase/thioesterase domain-containing protein
MGLYGTNAQAVLEEAPCYRSLEYASARASLPHQILCISGQSESALIAQIQRYAQRLKALDGQQDFADFCFTANSGRKHFAHRIFVSAENASIGRQKLLATDRCSTASLIGRKDQKRTPVAFLFTGQGAQYVGMGQELYDSDRAFRGALDYCASILNPIMGGSLIDILYPSASHSNGSASLDDIEWSQPALFAFEWSLYQLWRSWGIEPDLVLGHSLGELVAACCAGLFSVADGLAFAAGRGRLIQSTPLGAMVNIHADHRQVRNALAPYADRLCVAALNGPHNIVVSGDPSAIGELIKQLGKSGVDAHGLRISRGGHSMLMDPIVKELEHVASKLNYSALKVKLISTWSGQLSSFEELSQPAYWSSQLRDSVRFSAAIDTLLSEGCNTFVEIGPHPVLLTMSRECVSDPDSFLFLPSLCRGIRATERLLESLGHLYIQGTEPNWQAFYQDSNVYRTSLPTYPFQRKVLHHPLLTGKQAHIARAVVSDSTLSAKNSLLHRLQTASSSERNEKLLEVLRTLFESVTGRAMELASPEANLLDAGLDSLRVIDLLTGIRAKTGLVCSPKDFTSRATLRSFAEFLADRIANCHENRSGNSTAKLTESPNLRAEGATAAGSPPVITLHASGSRAPLICMHPSGGNISVYLRWPKLMGDDQPIYAIPSRALEAPENEFSSLEAMACSYADAIDAKLPKVRCQLLGWSMGGLLAHRVASELELRGREIRGVTMIDPAVRASNEPKLGVVDFAFAVASSIYDVDPHALLRTEVPISILENRHSENFTATDLLRFCEARGLLPHGIVSAEEFHAMVRLRCVHFRLVCDFKPRICKAPVRVWWSGQRDVRSDWSKYCGGGLHERTLDGTHFTIMRSPLVDEIVADFLSRPELQL